VGKNRTATPPQLNGLIVDGCDNLHSHQGVAYQYPGQSGAGYFAALQQQGSVEYRRLRTDGFSRIMLPGIDAAGGPVFVMYQ
jgi:hypothetical protein